MTGRNRNPLGVFLVLAVLFVSACGGPERDAESRASALVEEAIDVSGLDEGNRSVRWGGNDADTFRNTATRACAEAHPDRTDQWFSEAGLALVQRGELYGAEPAELVASHFESAGWEVRRQQHGESELPAIVDAVSPEDEAVRVFATATQFTFSAAAGPCAGHRLRDADGAQEIVERIVSR